MANFRDIPHRFDITKILASIYSHKGGIAPGFLLSQLIYNNQKQQRENPVFGDIPEADQLKVVTDLGTPIRKADAMGRMYFMPVILKATDGGEIEIPHAVISFNGKKTIVKTPLPGARGSVKELITLNDYSIELAGIVIGADGNYPEEELTKLRELWEVNESIELICAITDIWIGLNTQIVLESVDIPEVGAFEDAQIVRFTAETDSQFDLILE